MLDQLVQSLISTKNEAADDVLLEGLDRGNEREKSLCFNTLVRRGTVRGLSGVVVRFDQLSTALQGVTLQSIRAFHPALRHCGRGGDVPTRMAALQLIALGRQGKLAYVISENLHETDDILSRAAVNAMVELARWVSDETRQLNLLDPESFGEGTTASTVVVGRQSLLPVEAQVQSPLAIYKHLMSERAEIEQAVARAIDVHRGRHGNDLLRAALLLADWPGSRTLAILHTAKHGGQSPMVRRLQQPPVSEHVEAFLLGASHGGLRSQFGSIFSHIDNEETFARLLHRTHWVKDHQLQLCMHQVTRGKWLQSDLAPMSATDTMRVGGWVAASGLADQAMDAKLKSLYEQSSESVSARMHLLRLGMQRKRGTSLELLKRVLTDSDERLARIAAREIIRRRPSDMENILLQLLTNAPESVRQVVSRSIGHVGFEHYWSRFDSLPKATRKSAGRAMFKLLPDSTARLSRRLSSGPVEQRLKAMQMAQELDQASAVKDILLELVQHAHPRIRSKAVAMLGEMEGVDFGVLLDKALTDVDARVRANAIEVLESRRKAEYVPMLTNRARSAQNRERANAIKAIHRLRAGTAGTQLHAMLQDARAEHRISAMWALRQIGWWQLLKEVGRMAKEDTDMKVRRYALSMLRNVADGAQAKRAALVKAG